MWAITSNGVGEFVGARSIKAGWPLAPGEIFTTTEDPTGKVLDADGVTLRDETQADRDARRLAQIQGGVQALFANPDPQERLMAAIIKEMAKDIAQAKGLTPAQYRDDILSRILS